MVNKRKMNLKKYGLSNNRYYELRYFCAQYREWLNRIKEIDSGYQRETQRKKDPTSELAVKRAELSEKVQMVERAAKEAGGDIWEALLRNVCGEVSSYYLIDIERLPISQSAFLQRRRYFFFVLSREKK